MKNKNYTFNSSKAKEYFLEKISFETTSRELDECIKHHIDDLNIVDVRKYEDYIEGHIPFAIHVPLDSLEEHLVMFEKDKVNIVYSYCPYCKLGLEAAQMIAEKGYPVMHLCGGFKIWKEIGLDVVKTGSEE